MDEMLRNALLKATAIGLGKTFVKGNKLFCYVYIKTGAYGKQTRFLLPAALAYGIKSGRFLERLAK